tara:strand:- start:2792 stop:3226 length:435 start_codon:yes stop_codon:yes gene_type:complete
MSKTLSKRHKRGTHSAKKKTVKKSKSVSRKNNSRKTRKGNKSGKRKSNKSGKKKSSKSGKKKSSKSGKKKSSKSGKSKRKSKSKNKDLLRLYGGSRRCGSNHVFVPGINIESSIPSVEPLYLEDKMALIEDKVIFKKVDHARHN